ncbi:hypothetical protein AgCh_026357 [Apium graveolens]
MLGLFAFGFHPQGDNSYGVGIFLAGLGLPLHKAVVWTANRDNPLVSEDSISSASMLDTGNFLMYDSSQNKIRQSFDHPDTILPYLWVSPEPEKEALTDLESKAKKEPRRGILIIAAGEKEFQNQMKVIGRSHHRNLFRLLGYSVEGPHKLLVYEYMLNGSLADVLFDPENPPKWDERIRIALDIARGILFLHEKENNDMIMITGYMIMPKQPKFLVGKGAQRHVDKLRDHVKAEKKSMTSGPRV